jgi:hypothetical protein
MKRYEQPVGWRCVKQIRSGRLKPRTLSVADTEMNCAPACCGRSAFVDFRAPQISLISSEHSYVAPKLHDIQTSFGTSLEPLHAVKTSGPRKIKKMLSRDRYLDGGRTRTRTLDPLIKSQRVGFRAMACSAYNCLKTRKALPTTSRSFSATSSAACLGLSEIILTRDGCAARNSCKRRTITLLNGSRMA